MILLNDIIQVLALPKRFGIREQTLLLQLGNRLGISRILIHVDDPRRGGVGGVEGLAEEALGGLGIALGTQQKVQRVALRVHRSIEILPLAVDLQVGVAN